MSKRQITIKPSCLNEISQFPPERYASLWEKINWLVTDPFPDGHVKKKLHDGDGVFRLRVGEYRVFYRFGDEWVSLLGVRRRKEDTYSAIPEEKEAPALPPGDAADLDALLAPAKPRAFTFEAVDAAKQLPIAITKGWLQEHQIPPAHYPVLLRCKTEEDLLEADLPGVITSRVLDALYPPALDELVRQPDMVVPSTDDLIRYQQGDLLGFLLKLDEDQIRLTRWAMKGPTMVRGGAGTGKSTVALYRVNEVLDREGAEEGETVLFTTYTRALLTVTRQLLEQIVSPERMARVRVATVDQIAYEIVASTRTIGNLEGGHEARQRLKALRATFSPSADSAFEAKLRERALARLSDKYLLEEFEWIIDGRGIETLEDYLEAPRPGRGVPFPQRLRESVWELYTAFRSGAAKERFPALRNDALSLVKAGTWTGHWDHVFVDEAQDLSPSALMLMAEVAKTPEGLFFAADSKQSLYSRNYTWSSVHPRLQFQGRTAMLRRNYRSTAEIDRAAFSLLEPEDEEQYEPSASVHQGPLPVLLKGVDEAQEAEWVARFIRQMARHLHLRTNAAAVLVPSNEAGEVMAELLRSSGLDARYYKGRDLNLSADVIKVITLYSAKGLEFPIVVVAGFYEGTYPVVEDFDEAELFAERMRHARRLLYVGCTRAMRGMMLVVPRECRHEALLDLDTNDWYVEEIR